MITTKVIDNVEYECNTIHQILLNSTDIEECKKMLDRGDYKTCYIYSSSPQKVEDKHE